MHQNFPHLEKPYVSKGEVCLEGYMEDSVAVSALPDARIGIITPALAAYWSQMPGSRDVVLASNQVVAERCMKMGRVCNHGIIDDVTAARRVEQEIREQDLDVLILHAGTYGISRNVLPFVRKLGIPIITLHLQPVEGFGDKSSSDFTIPRNSFSIAGELGAVLARAGKRFVPIAGRLENDERPWRELEEWIRAVRLKRFFENATIAMLGNFYQGMCDTYADFTDLILAFGVNIEIREASDVRKHFVAVHEQEIARLAEQVGTMFTFDDRITPGKLELPLRVASALRRFVNEEGLNGVAFHMGGYPESDEEKIGYSMTLGGSLLAAEGVPFSAEGDLTLLIPLLMLKQLLGGATQTEINVADFTAGIIYFSHSGPGDLSLAHSKPGLKWLDFFHGRRGNGVSCDFGLRPGPVTILSLTKRENGKYVFIATEAEAQEGPRLQNGNVNTRISFGRPIEDFVEQWTIQGPTHHAAIGCGRCIGTLRKAANVMGIEFVEIN